MTTSGPDPHLRAALTGLLAEGRVSTVTHRSTIPLCNAGTTPHLQLRTHRLSRGFVPGRKA